MNVLLPLAVVAITGTATIALADNSFSYGRLQPTASSVYFDLVTSDAAGVVEIYDYHGYQVGKLLGSQPVALGSNPGLRIEISPYPYQSVMAFLVIDGVKVADQEVRFRLRGR